MPVVRSSGPVRDRGADLAIFLSLGRCTVQGSVLHSARRSQPPDQLAGVDLEALSDLQNVVQRDVAAAPLDLADEGPVQTTVVSELLLTLAQLVTASADPVSEDPRCW